LEVKPNGVYALYTGTFLFLLLGLAGIQAARDASTSGLDAAFLLMASTSMAMALTLAIFIFFRITGAAFVVFLRHILDLGSPDAFLLDCVLFFPRFSCK